MIDRTKSTSKQSNEISQSHTLFVSILMFANVSIGIYAEISLLYFFVYNNNNPILVGFTVLMLFGRIVHFLPTSIVLMDFLSQSNERKSDANRETFKLLLKS